MTRGRVGGRVQVPGDRVEKEVRLIPSEPAPVNLDAAARHGLEHTGSGAWSCLSIYLDTPARELVRRDASLSINHAPGDPKPVGWLGFKAGVRMAGVVRHALDERFYHGLATVPEISDVLASGAPPVERVARLLAPTACDRLEAVLMLTQRRTQHRFMGSDGAEVVVSEDDLCVRPISSAGGDRGLRRFRLVEVDLTDVADEATMWPFLDELMAAGMAPTPLPKYALGLRLLRS